MENKKFIVDVDDFEMEDIDTFSKKIFDRDIKRKQNELMEDFIRREYGNNDYFTKKLLMQTFFDLEEVLIKREAKNIKLCGINSFKETINKRKNLETGEDLIGNYKKFLNIEMADLDFYLDFIKLFGFEKQHFILLNFTFKREYLEDNNNKRELYGSVIHDIKFDIFFNCGEKNISDVQDTLRFFRGIYDYYNTVSNKLEVKSYIKNLNNSILESQKEHLDKIDS